MSYSHFGAPTTYNGTGENGGDPSFVNLNQWYTTGDTSFILFASCLVMFMVPGIALLYSGLARRKSALSLLWVVMMSFSVLTFQWYFWGYSLAYSSTASNSFIGNLHHFGLRHVLGAPSQGSPLVSSLLYSWFQLMFCAVTGALVVGAVCERGRAFPAMVFIFAWATVVYCPIAYWVWNANGWAFKWGVFDYAGGGPVEIASGMSALAYSMVLGRRNAFLMGNYRPHNISLVMIGTIMLFFGWMGFNGGSAFGANLRAVISCWNTTLTAGFAGMAWVVLDFRLSHKLSMVGWCSGTISGLVAATPASGFISMWASIVLGIVAGIVCNFATKIKYMLQIDDSLDVFAEHAVGGIIGLLFNGLFAEENVIALDGINVGVNGGWVDHVYSRLYKQFAYICAASAYSFAVSYILARGIDLIPGLHLRVTHDGELFGTDDDQHGEYSYDYVEVRRDYLAWTPATDYPQTGELDGVYANPQLGIPQHATLAAASQAEKERHRGDAAAAAAAEPEKVSRLTRILGPTTPAAARSPPQSKSGRPDSNGSAPNSSTASASPTAVGGAATTSAGIGASAGAVPGPAPVAGGADTITKRD
ncbi:hypothetical protein BROUX41_004475 [Berkeleyomyces rouxiae]